MHEVGCMREESEDAWGGCRREDAGGRMHQRGQRMHEGGCMKEDA